MIARALLLRRALRFELWALRLRIELRRRGGRLILDAPHRARFRGAPRIEMDDDGAVLTLTIGRDVSLGRDLILEPRGTCALALGDGSWFGHAARVQLRDGGSIGLAPHVQVRDGVVLKSSGRLTVGEEVTIGHHDVIACSAAIAIGDLAGLGERVTVTDSDHTPDGSGAHYLRRPLRTTPVSIGSNVLVSANAVILRGARVGDNAVVAAGAVLREGEHAGGWLHAGAPAAPVRRLERAGT